MDILRHPSPPLSPKKLSHQQPTVSLPPYSRTYEGDEDSLSSKTLLDEEKPSKRSNKPRDHETTDKASSKKPRHRHSPAQLACLNALFDRNEHPSLDERNELARKLEMEMKTVNAWFQNKRASAKKRNKGAPSEPSTTDDRDVQPSEKFPDAPPPSTLPSIASLLSATPPHPVSQLPPSQASRPRSRTASSRKSKQKDLHLNDHLLADPSISQGQNNSQESALESSFFAGPNEFFSVISHNRGHSEDGAVPTLHNLDSDPLLPDTNRRFVSENDGSTNDHSSSRKRRGEALRMRTSPEQADALRRAYSINPQPTPDQRRELAIKIGMRVQSVTNWFQNQRSQAKKHKEESPSAPDLSPPLALQRSVGSGDEPPELYMPHPPLPPRSHHPSLRIPERDSHLSHSLELSHTGLEDHYREARSRMSLPPSFHSRMPSPRARRSITPYAREPRDLHPEDGRHYDNSSVTRRPEDGLLHPRRSRPEPHQLDALKWLLHRTCTPSIEERSALALQVGMDIGKVTNWFRNIRQTTRRRAAAGSHRGRRAYPYELDASSGSSIYDDDDAMDLDYEDTVDQGMDERSEDEYQEALTPSSDISSSPPPAQRPLSHHPGMETMGIGLIEPSAFHELEKAVGMTSASGPSAYALGSRMNTATYSGVKIEDALLLLSFHQHVVH
ncbi:hypothetical protein BU15DRAFT_40442 [Melanogaster broomeanus]|nr:hypothetical protein BU15DRAFT_40442 [Melanogaster broomeanus]